RLRAGDVRAIFARSHLRRRGVAEPLRQREAGRAAGDPDEPPGRAAGRGKREGGRVAGPDTHPSLFPHPSSPGADPAHGPRPPPGVSPGRSVVVERRDGSRSLVVPVIKHAEAMDFATFHATYETLVEKARANRLLPDDFAGATITLTNPGTLGTVASVPRLL